MAERQRADRLLVARGLFDSRARAHAFYRHLGYERTSIRFMKKL